MLAAAPAAAFEDATQFFVGAEPHAATYGASGEGVYFTGAPRFTSLNCSTCHIDGPGIIRLKLGADHPEIFSTGYVPNQTYLFEVELFAESKGLMYNSAGCTEPPTKDDHYSYVQCNSNGFALEVDLAGGPPLAGPNVFCAQAPVNGVCPAPNPAADETIVGPDGDAVFAERQHPTANPGQVLRNDPTDWHLWWTAPPAGSGALTVFIAAVDGNGGSGTVDNDQDPYNDDTVQASFTVQEQGTPSTPATTAGCAVPGPGAPLNGFGDAALLLVAAALLRRREGHSRASNF
jgi:hypothetical protein